jgi:hypothetical protein
LINLAHTNTGGTPAAGFGAAILTRLETTSALRDASRFVTQWVSPTDGAEKAAVVIETTNSGTLTECARFDYFTGNTFSCAGTPAIFTRTIAASTGNVQGAAQFGLTGFSSAPGDGGSMLFFAPDNGGVKGFVGRVSGVADVSSGGAVSGVGLFAGAMVISVRANAADSTAITEVMRCNSSSSVLIGTSTNNTSAILNVTSTTKGILFPRMTTTQRDAISGATDGLVIYNSTVNKFQGRAAAAWVDFH